MIRYFGITDLGCSRPSNEDAFVLEPELGLFLVADGMGGAQAGEKASSVAVETIVRCVRDAAPARSTEVLEQAIHAANNRVLELAAANPEYRGMGTTVVAILLDPPGAHIASVGDSRVYRLRDAALERVTVDQTWVNEIGRTLGLTEEQIHSHPFRNVLTMAVGSRESIEMRAYELQLAPGDLFLLCSDGLHGQVADPELAETLNADGSLGDKGARLVNKARAAGGPDNITAVLVQHAAA